MTIDRAIEILTPDRRPDYTPAEYEAAHKMAVLALELVKCSTALQTIVKAEMEARERGEV